jgi:hypothetical protein
MMPFLGFTGNWGARGRAQAERLADLARKCGDLTPLREPVRQVLIQGNRARAVAGTDVEGIPYEDYAPLAPSTLRRRRGDGPPLAPRYANSRIVTAYEVDVQVGTGRLSFIGGWPALPWMEYHHTGTARMPRRDPYGFTVKTLEEVRTLLREHYRKNRAGR